MSLCCPAEVPTSLAPCPGPKQMVDVHSCVYTMADAFRLGIHVAEGKWAEPDWASYRAPAPFGFVTLPLPSNEPCMAQHVYV